MNLYYDTSILLKLYFEEAGTDRAQDFVQTRGESIQIHALHRSEMVSAFRQKVFREEIQQGITTQCLNNIEDDVSNGILRLTDMDWNQVWMLCRNIADTYGAQSGCRTLDTLHIACARSLAFRQIVTNDGRQAALARLVGMEVINPLA